MPSARNDAELRSMLIPALQKATDYVIQRAQEDNVLAIGETVYNAGYPMEYQRTNSMISAWNQSSGGGVGDASSYLESDPSMLPPHTSVVDGSDISDALFEIVFEGKAGLALGDGYWRKARNAYKTLVKTLGKAKIKAYFKEGMQSAGLTIAKTGTVDISSS